MRNIFGAKASLHVKIGSKATKNIWQDSYVLPMKNGKWSNKILVMEKFLFIDRVLFGLETKMSILVRVISEQLMKLLCRSTVSSKKERKKSNLYTLRKLSTRHLNIWRYSNLNIQMNGIIGLHFISQKEDL
jgi:hypothetical protein